MKTLFAVVTMGAVMTSGLLFSSKVHAEPEIDDAMVNAKVDARIARVRLEHALGRDAKAAP